MGTRLYVGNLPYAVTELDLRDLFGSIGTVTDAKIVTDRETGRPRGFGFVEMSTEDEARKAIEELNGRDVQGRQVAVKEAEDRRGGGGGGGGRGGSKAEPWMPWMPWSAAVYDYNSKNESKYDPEGYCLPPGGPRMMATPYQMEIIQLPEHKRILMVFEGATHIWREIYMDGRPFPEGDALNPTYLGMSVGRFENPDTLVVENKGFNENSWLDYFGHPHTDLMHITERWTRPSKQTLHYEATVTDPGAYTRPFTMAWDVPFNQTNELPEYICQENNQYLNRLVDDFGQPIFGPRQQPGTRPAGGTR